MLQRPGSDNALKSITYCIGDYCYASVMSLLITIEVTHLRTNRSRIHFMEPGKTHQ